MDKEVEEAIRRLKPSMEAIVYLKEGRIVRVESPDGIELADDDRSENLRSVIAMYENWPERVNARLFVYKNGGIGVSIE